MHHCSWYVRAVDAIGRIRELLDSTDEETVGTSMRLPAALREAATLAVSELGAATSTTALAADALWLHLDALVTEAALDAHEDRYPELRPSLAELAIATAELDGNPLAERPDAIRRAAAAIIERHPNADADDVLLWAEAQAAAA